ncbi:hypothetical protein N1027_17290 [Herbiconiux sp. CPCC 205763]|uniref:Uncharacterized protein n=1 Tax=Herbiconiux aconitum TaxID=2970913 RepID=A0ABT2GUJ5_9MICO|nr:hypothetical protein [Herbiconiux aconitum]MCS5719887.1 hypothetical protein [Herbiconiux aconitum]
MTHQPRSRVVRLGFTAHGEPVPLALGASDARLLVVGGRQPVLAVARSLIVQLTAQCAAPVLLRADDRITIDDVPVVALVTDETVRPPPPTPNGDTPRLTIDDVPWALLHADARIRVRCLLTSRAEFPALLEAARMRGRERTGRHARADENGGHSAAVALIS